MRITIPCPDVQSYIENPRNFLPKKPACLNDPSHKPYWNTHWDRDLCLDHVRATKITLFNAYCKTCHETISFWPEFVLPYQREPLETHEQVVVEHLQGVCLRESAAKIGYDPRTVSRWIKLILAQGMVLIDEVTPRLLGFLGQAVLPLKALGPKETAMLLFAWLRGFAGDISFGHLDRLMGLGNLIGKGDWDLWGAPLGRAKSRVKEGIAPG